MSKWVQKKACSLHWKDYTIQRHEDTIRFHVFRGNLLIDNRNMYFLSNAKALAEGDYADRLEMGEVEAEVSE